MNVLILSAAAKVLLVRAFAEAGHMRGGRVFAADLAADNAALFEADGAVLLPRSDSADFFDALANYCAEHAISLVVPTRAATARTASPVKSSGISVKSSGSTRAR